MYFPKMNDSKDGRASFQAMITLILLLMAIFVCGGSARGDEVRLLALRPISVIALLIGICLIRAKHIGEHKFLILWFFSIVTLAVVHLLPLPPSLWQSLPGREPIVKLDSVMGYAENWRPISMSPELTRNSLWAIMAPLACFLLAIQLDFAQLIRILIIVVFFSLASGVLAIVQLTEGAGSSIYLYRVSNFGAAVGLFANRNHQALLMVLMLPISVFLLVIKSGALRLNRLPKSSLVAQFIKLSVTVFLFVLVASTGSRSGIVLFGMVAVSTYCYFSTTSRRSVESSVAGTSSSMPHQTGRKSQLFQFIFVLLSFAALTLFGRNEAVKRLLGTTTDNEARLSIFHNLIEAALAYFPVGSGLGTFDPVFRIHETSEVLAPTYWNHAHNDWLEVLITGGAPATLILCSIIVWILHALFINRGRHSASFESQGMKFIGASIVIALALASFVEYPLRVPILASVFAIGLALVSKCTSPNPGPSFRK